jgi:2'-5' RNA ligase
LPAVPRVRLGVVIVVPEPVATEIQALRRALGDPVLDRIMPHVTLVPPVNVRSDDLPAARAVLRAAAATVGPMSLTLGPPRTFGPASPTLYLPVDGDRDDLERLGRLRAAAFVAPLERTVDHEFVPHVTVAAELATPRLVAAASALADYRSSFVADTVTLLRYEKGTRAELDAADEDAGVDPGRTHARWEPTADVRLGRPAIVGRGGYELELTVSSILDVEALQLLDEADRLSGALDWFARPRAFGVAPGARLVVMTARHHDEVVGVGWAHAWSPDARSPGRGSVAAVVASGLAREDVERQIELALESVIAEA